MIDLPENFLVAEEREDFFVSETMKRYWASCMDILSVIDGLCKKHGIIYYADWGTLLGAARHEGFIPWDDDIDIALKRPDYEKLLKVLREELPENYSVSSPMYDVNHKQFFSGVSNSYKANQLKAHIERFYGCPFVAVIDIFPLDYLPRDEQEASVLRSVFIVIWNAINLMEKEGKEDEIEGAVCQVEEFLGVVIERNENMLNQLWKLANLLVMSYDEKDGEQLVPWCSYVNKRIIYKKEWYDEVEYLPFENMQIPAPKEYRMVLNAMYGDWEKRVKGGQAHNYPIFKNQLEELKQKVKEANEAEEKI